MNKYLREWIDETYPLMGDDIEELDHFDLQKFADWVVKRFSITPTSQEVCVQTGQYCGFPCFDGCPQIRSLNFPTPF